MGGWEIAVHLLTFMHICNGQRYSWLCVKDVAGGHVFESGTRGPKQIAVNPTGGIFVFHVEGKETI